MKLSRQGRKLLTDAERVRRIAVLVIRVIAARAIDPRSHVVFQRSGGGREARAHRRAGEEADLEIAMLMLV